MSENERSVWWHQNKIGPKSRVQGQAPSHPNSWTEKCPLQPTVWVMAHCWLIKLFKGGINLFLNWVWNRHYIDLIWWSWSVLTPTAGTLLFFYDHLEVLLISGAHQLLKKGTCTLLSLPCCLWSCDRSVKGGSQICHAEMWCSCGSGSSRLGLPRKKSGQGLLAAEASSLCSMGSVSNSFLVTLEVTLHLLVVASVSLTSRGTVWPIVNDGALIVQLGVNNVL